MSLTKRYQEVTAFLERVHFNSREKNWWIALSGGQDSMVLLHLLQQWCQDHSRHLRAIHIHHGYSDKADEWVRHCHEQCESLGVPLTILKMDSSSSINIDQGLEAYWRQQRYQLITNHTNRGDEIFLAHHQCDQVETLLMRLFRGSGPKGLASMQATHQRNQRYWHRPLLHWSVSEVGRYAGQYKLHWINDPSNDDQRFDRNFIRHQLLPSLQARWPSVVNSIARSASHCSSESQLLQHYLTQDMQPHLNTDGSLCLRFWQSQIAIKQIPILRHWLASYEPYGVTELQWHAWVPQLQGWHSHMQVALKTPKGHIRVYRARIYWVPTKLATPLEPYDWDVSQSLICVSGGYRFTMKEPQKLHLQVASRQHYTKLRLSPQQPRQTLKTIFQQLNVPPWLRSSLPLVTHNDVLWMMPGYFQAKHDFAPDLSYEQALKA